MRKTTFLCQKSIMLTLLATLFFLASTGDLNAQVSFSAKEPTVKQIIESVKSQGEYQFFYDSKLADIKVNSVDLKNVPVEVLLRESFKGCDVSYKIEDKIVYLSVLAATESNKAQSDRLITGMITDTKGEPLIGVTVAVSGTTSGVASGIDGKYSIRLSGSTSQLTFSYIGYISQVVNAGDRSVIDVVMQESTMVMDNVVVTAMGIKREEKTLTYNVQSVGASEITTVKDPNFMGSLAGKIAGVTINQSSSGIGGSTRVVMRGAKSISGDNNALYVLDGIPLSSLRTKQSENYAEVDIQGDAEGISNINPDDIESMSVLTGAAAAALYGNRGANGVILITTKKGSKKGSSVSYSNNTTFSSPFVMPKFQNTYDKVGESYKSWGAKMDTPSSYNPKDFFQTGYNTMNTVSVSAGNEMHSMYASLGATNAEGIIPNQTYERYNFSLRTSSALVKDKLTLDLGLNYMDQKDQNMIGQGLYYNPIAAIYLFPPGDDINRYLPYEIWSGERNFKVQNWPYMNESHESVKQNPFWITNRNMFNNSRDRVIMNGALTYNITDWINLSVRTRIDRANSLFERKLYASTHTLFAHGDKGFFSHYKLRNENIYADWLLNIDKSISDDFRITANFGGSFNDEKYDYEGYTGTLRTQPNHFHVQNIAKEKDDWERSHTRTTALYGTAQLGYKNMAFLDITGRFDYFSSLYSPVNPKPRIFYPSVGLSLLVSEIFSIDRDLVPMWKVRTSFSQVGNPPDPYKTINYVSVDGGNYQLAKDRRVKLKAEQTKAFEIGTDLKMLGNKLDFSITYYNTNTYNQLFRYELPPSSGNAYGLANAGKVNNWGVETTLGINQKIGEVYWNGTIAYTFNRNQIKELLGETIIDPVSGEVMAAPKEFVVANAREAYVMKLVKGGSMSDIYVNSLKRDLNGNIFVHPGSGNISVDPGKKHKVGSAAPKYNLSMRNNFTWKDVSLAFMLDARVGGIVVSSTQALMDQFGVSEASAIARDNGGVPINQGKVDAKHYYETIGGDKIGSALSEYTYSATNVRLRELSVTYNLPQKWFRDKLDISVSFIGRNLFMIYNKAPFDPELTASTGTYYQGYDCFMPPSQRNIGFGVSMKF